MIDPPYPSNIPLKKGSLISIDPTSGTATTIPFQYNPETVTRQLSAAGEAEPQGHQYQPVRYPVAPKETISLEVQIDVIDEMDAGDSDATDLGVTPQLAALELLLYPPSSQVVQYQTALASGSIEIIPSTKPRTLFNWGSDKTLPVQLTSLSITEELFDAGLTPIRAQVSLSLRVLSYSDLFADDEDYSVFMTYQQSLEKLAGRS